MSDDADVHRARSLIDLGRYGEARETLGRRLAHSPDDSRALLLLARAHAGAGDHRDAVQTAGRILTLDPDDGEALRIAARGHSRLGEHALAHDAAVAAVRADPGAPDSHIVLAEVGIAQRYIAADALDAAETAVRMAPWSSATHITLGNVQRKMRRPRKARESYETALRIDSQSSAARNNLALLGLDRGRAGSTAQTMTGLLRNDPLNRTASRNLLASVAVAMRNARIGLIGPFIALEVIDFGAFGTDPSTILTARITAAVLALMIGVGYPALVLRRGGPGLRRFVMDLLRRDRLFVVCVALLAAAVGLFAAAPAIDFVATDSTFVYLFTIVAGNLLGRQWVKTRRTG